MIHINDISYNINGNIIFENLQLNINKSSLVYIKGKNGSGKTSLLKIIAQIKHPSTGKVIIDNYNNHNISSVLYLGHQNTIKNELSVRDHLQFYTKLYDDNKSNRSDNLVKIAAKYWNLTDKLNIDAGALSAGNKQKIHLSKLICCPSDIWLLDEVDINLDKDNLQLLSNLILSAVKSGKIIIFSSHQNLFIDQKFITNIIDLDSYDI